MAATDKPLDCFYALHEGVYKEWLHDNTWVSSSQTAHEYFQLRMFVRKDMRVIADSRRVHQMAVTLHKYSTDDYKLTNFELPCKQLLFRSTTQPSAVPILHTLTSRFQYHNGLSVQCRVPWPCRCTRHSVPQQHLLSRRTLATDSVPPKFVLPGHFR